MSQIYPRTIIEPAPNHDTTNPSFTAWRMIETDATTQTEPTATNRPKWSIQIYDTTLNAHSHDHIRATVQRLQEDTVSGRNRYGLDHPDRLDMYGLPLPADTPPEERVAKCIAHLDAEVAARDATGTSDFFIPQAFNDYDREFIIIAKPEQDWDQGDGGFIHVHYRFKDQEKKLEPYWCPCTKEELDEMLGRSDFREMIQWFYETYVEEGMMDEYLRERRSS